MTQTKTWTSYGKKSWTVPAGVDEITVKAWGAGTNSASGGYTEVTNVPVDRGDSIYIYVGGSNSGGSGGWPDGGDGNNAAIDTSSASSNGGAGSSKVRLNDDSHSGSVAVAGGAGGAGNAEAGGTTAYQYDDSSFGAEGHGNAPDATADGKTAEGGHVGESSTENGVNGPSDFEYDSADSDSFYGSAAGGGGGGGYSGGGSGEAKVSTSDTIGQVWAIGAGGGGGSSYGTVNSDSTSFTAGGGNDGSGKVVIEYDVYLVSVYNGTEWVRTPLKTFDGNSWNRIRPKIYNGSNFE